MFEQLHIVGDRAFELRAEAYTVYKVRTYQLTEDGTELDPAEIEFAQKDLAEMYIEGMVNRLKGEDNDGRTGNEKSD